MYCGGTNGSRVFQIDIYEIVSIFKHSIKPFIIRHFEVKAVGYRMQYFTTLSNQNWRYYSQLKWRTTYLTSFGNTNL